MAQALKRRRRTPAQWSDKVGDLQDYLRAPIPRIARRGSRDEGPVVVSDDWPAMVPITDAELRVLESHFAKELDALFGPLP